MNDLKRILIKYPYRDPEVFLERLRRYSTIEERIHVNKEYDYLSSRLGYFDDYDS